MRKSRKGQVAVEFLSTYSWAILGILLAIGAVSYFDLMSPDRYAQEKCIVSKQLECTEVEYDDTGDFQIVLRNNYPVDLTIDELVIIDEDGTSFTAIDVGIPQGQESVPPITGTLRPRREGQKADLSLIVRFKRTGGDTVFNATGVVVTRVIRI